MPAGSPRETPFSGSGAALPELIEIKSRTIHARPRSPWPGNGKSGPRRARVGRSARRCGAQETGTEARMRRSRDPVLAALLLLAWAGAAVAAEPARPGAPAAGARKAVEPSPGEI